MLRARPQHPFILKAGKTEVIQRLVDDCIPQIDEYREMEAKEAEQNAVTSRLPHPPPPPPANVCMRALVAYVRMCIPCALLSARTCT